MYTLTVKIADKGTIYVNQDPENPSSHPSKTGHMWYSISNGASSYDFGFAPKKGGSAIGAGEIKKDDSKAYQSTYYTGQIVITAQQYDKLKSFGNNPSVSPYNFGLFYTGGGHDCINFVWKALEISGFNPEVNDGSFWPSWNADETDKALYRSLFGNKTETIHFMVVITLMPYVETKTKIYYMASMAMILLLVAEVRIPLMAAKAKIYS